MIVAIPIYQKADLLDVAATAEIFAPYRLHLRRREIL